MILVLVAASARNASSVESMDVKESVDKRSVLAVVVVGVLMAAIDTTIVILALPTIDTYFHTSPTISIWIIMAYILVLTVLSAQVGKIGDRFGRAKMYNYGFLVFIVGSALCGLSTSIFMLIGARVLQAVGGAFLSTNSSAVVSDHFEPHERGKAFGYTGMGWNMGAILGIFLGGALTSIDWRLIFLINVPIGAIALPIAFRKVKDVIKKKKEKYDIAGSIILGVALTLLTIMAIFAMTEGLTPHIVEFLGVAAALFAAFGIMQRREKAPTIDPSIFKNRVFTLSVLAGTFQFMATFAVLFILILYLQGVRSLSPLMSSLYLLPGYVVGGLLAPVSGRLSDRIGARIPATAGLLLIAFAYLLYITLLTPTSPLYYILIITLFTGLGSALFFPSNTSAIMANAPKDKYGMASGVNRLLNNVGMVLSFVFALTIISIAIPRNVALAIFAGTQIGVASTAGFGAAFTKGLDAALLISIVIILIAVVMSAVRGKEDRRAPTQ